MGVASVKPGTVVEIEWADHAFYGGEYDGGGLANQRSVGFFVSEDDDVIRIAQSMTTDERSATPRPNETLVIDKRMMIRRRIVR